MASAVRTEGLTKLYGRRKAVVDLNLEVEEGDVYGFLGLNGAGKTTAMRLMLGLVRPTAGRVLFFGREVRRHFIEVMRQVGALVELPAAYPHLSAQKNLEILRLVTGGVPRRRIDEVLSMVGLSDRRQDRVSAYSQGMRQRLGIAMALLSKPRLVFLDEPINGLDPHGIRQVREVVRTLNREERVTFFISSHLLHEVELTCTRVGILKEGRLVLQDSVARVMERTTTGLRLRCRPRDKAAAVLRAHEGVDNVVEEGPEDIRVSCGSALFGRVNAALHENGIEVSELSPARQTLEDFFLSQ